MNVPARLATLAIAAVCLALPASAAAQVTVSNNNGIAINDGDCTSGSQTFVQAQATPYPSTIAVSGLAGQVADVDVALTGFSHTAPSDVRALLVGPEGQTALLLHENGAFFAATDLNLTFDDAATQSPPTDGGTALTTGSYKPSNQAEGALSCGGFSADSSFPSTAPAGPYGSTLAGFNGSDPNGTWSLYVVDTAGRDVGSIDGWSLVLSMKPTAVDDSRRVNEDSGASTFRVRANDVMADGAPFVVESVSDPAHGTAAVANGGLLVSYTPDPDYCNPAPQPEDTFTYTLSGGSTATVSVNVRCVDDPPTAVDDSPGRINEDSGPHLFRVLTNDVNADGGKLVVESVSDPAHGTAAVVNNGTRVSYTPDSGYCNPSPQPDDTFTYTLNGGSTATVTVNVKCLDG